MIGSGTPTAATICDTDGCAAPAVALNVRAFPGSRVRLVVYCPEHDPGEGYPIALAELMTAVDLALWIRHFRTKRWGTTASRLLIDRLADTGNRKTTGGPK